MVVLVGWLDTGRFTATPVLRWGYRPSAHLTAVLPLPNRSRAEPTRGLRLSQRGECLYDMTIPAMHLGAGVYVPARDRHVVQAVADAQVQRQPLDRPLV